LCLRGGIVFLLTVEKPVYTFLGTKSLGCRPIWQIPLEGFTLGDKVKGHFGSMRLMGFEIIFWN